MSANPAALEMGWGSKMMKDECGGVRDSVDQDRWRSSFEGSDGRPTAELLDYMKSVYGPDAFLDDNKVVARHVGFYWNSVPRRSEFKPSWIPVGCSILGLRRVNALWAPIDDAQHSPKLLTQAMLERCNGGPCNAGDVCQSTWLRPLRSGAGQAGWFIAVAKRDRLERQP